METRNARIGMVLFLIYLALYGGFVLLNAYAATFMEQTPIGGVNLAVLCGFGLIIAALLLALLYGWLCRVEDDAAPVSSHTKPAAKSAAAEDSK